MIWIEDIRPTIGKLDRAVALALACLAPVRLLEKAAGARRRISVDDTAALIFSSGSEGDPKGVVLIPLQRRFQHRGHRPGLPDLPQRPDPRRPAAVPLVRLPAALAGALPRHGPGLPRQAAGVGHGRRAGRAVRRDGPLRHAGVPQHLHPPLQPPAVRLAAAGHRRGGEAARLGGPGLRGDLRHQGARGLRHDRVLAGGRRERSRLPRPGVLPAGLAAGDRRPPLAGRHHPRGPAREPRRAGRAVRARKPGAAAGEHRGHDPGQGPQRDEGLPQAGRPDPQGAARRLVRDRRPRPGGRGRLPQDHRPALAVLEDRRRDGPARPRRRGSQRGDRRRRAGLRRHVGSRWPRRRPAGRPAHRRATIGSTRRLQPSRSRDCPISSSPAAIIS